MNSNKHLLAAAITLGSLMTALAAPAQAISLYADDDSELELAIEAGAGTFHSDSSYAIARTDDDAVNWQEGYVNARLKGLLRLNEAGEMYAGTGLVSSAVLGDGDAAGFSTGDERRTSLDALYLGWRSGQSLAALGDNGLDISVGRQGFVIGDGFIINSDGLNVGKGLGSDLNRGGVYYMAARKTFDNTAIVRIGGDKGLRADLFRLQSDNRVMGEPTFTGINVEHISDLGTFASLYLKTESNGEFANPVRDGQKTVSGRYAGNAGIENLTLSTELVRQVSGDTTTVAHAGYAEAGWSFADAPWSPTLAYRFSSFDEHYDPLYYGFSRGFGTWFQGEVAANYAGPFSTNTDIHLVSLKASPAENLNLGINHFSFGNHKTDAALGNMNASELDIYAEYFPSETMMISPLVGWFNPQASAANGGTQLGDAHRSLYAQLMLFVFY